MAIILNGKENAEFAYQEMEKKFKDTKAGLVIISIGNDNASKIYMRNKHKACERLGINFFEKHFIEEEYLYNKENILNTIKEYNNDPEISGIIVQFPIGSPKNIDQKEAGKYLYAAIDPIKNVDGIYSETRCPHVPCTPEGCICLLDYNNITINNKKHLVIGRSPIVGKPLADILNNPSIGSEVKVAHSQTPKEEFVEMCKWADIIYSAVGKLDIVMPEYLRDDCSQIIIDIGINRNEYGKVCGDVNPACYDKLYAYSPVPGGVGPMTVAMLMFNTFQAANILEIREKNRNHKKYV